MVQSFDQPSSAARLEAALAPHWVVERVTDPDGDVSLIVLAADDDPALPTFLLHERDRAPHVAVIANDTWQSDRSFWVLSDACDAIIALATTARTERLEAA
jgi:hypothetical protein